MATALQLRPGFDLVPEKDPDGEIVAHEINRRQREIDALFDDGILDGEQYTCATDLRDAWERSGLADQSSALDTTRPKVDGGGAAPEMNSDALRLYEGSMSFLSRDERNCIHCIVLFDEAAISYGQRMRCSGIDFLRRCLDKIGPHVSRHSD